METPGDLLAYLSRALEELGLPYAVGGSLAAMAYGEPRYTRDLDVVVALRPEDVPRLIERFPFPAFYVDAATVRRAVRAHEQFNVIHPESGLKIDVYVAGDEVEQSQIARARRLTTAGGHVASFSPPEELIVKKLQHFAAGGGDRHLRDITSMLRITPDIDTERIESLAAGLGLSHIWRAVQVRLGGREPS